MSLMQRWREWRESRAEYRATVEEMRFHIEQETEHNMRRGMSPQAARREAAKAFGGVDRFAEQARDERTGTKLSDFAMSYLDWKLGARMLVKYPGLSVIGGVTLAAAIGLGAGWFEMTMLTLYPELPLEDGDRIVRIENIDAARSSPEPRVLYDFHAWREQLTSVEQLGAYRTVDRNLITRDGVSRPVQVAEISPVAFPLTRVPPLLGRPLEEADAQAGAPDVVVIGYDIWQRRFDGDATIVGTNVQLGRTTATIVGVMPEGFGFPRSHRLWVPLRETQVAPREGPAISVFGRLRDGATRAAAQAELTALGLRMAADHPATHAQLRPRVLGFAAPSGHGAAREALLINLFAWFVLAAAAANVATLMFARTAMRESEIVVRSALGASRLRVMGQLFTEALVLTSAAALVGLAGAALVIRYVFRVYAERQTPPPFWWDDRIEPITILYTAVLAILGAAFVGLLPAIRATGTRVQAGLTRMATGGTNMRFGGVWSVIIALQVAFSVLCLPFGIAAAYDTRHEYEMRAAFPADAYLTFRPELDLDEPARATSGDAADEAARARTADVFAELKRRLEEEPGVARVTSAALLPGMSHGLQKVEAQRGTEPPFIVDTNIEGNRARVASVGVDFFDTFQLPVVAGRVFHTADVGARNVVVINESLARSIGGNPVGVRVRAAAGADGTEPGPWHEIVGVSANVGLNPTARGDADFIFFPISDADARFLIVRVNGDAASFAPQLRALATQVDPGLRLYDLLPLREVIRRQDLPAIQLTFIGIGIILLAIVLSAASLYALMSVAVTRRTREIGIRVAVGASPRAVLASLFARAATQVGVGIAIGNVLFVLLLSAMVDTVQLRAVVLPMIIASTVMALVGFGACLVPGRRALRVQPTEALKQAG